MTCWTYKHCECENDCCATKSDQQMLSSHVQYLKPLLSSQRLRSTRKPAGAACNQASGPGVPHHLPAGGGGDLGVRKQAGQHSLQV